MSVLCSSLILVLALLFRALIFLPLFLSYLVFYLRVLHSFPTRRSSDLPTIPAHKSETRSPYRFSISSISNRSEEHTSELQSLRHLVCRLLLEKKNKNCAWPAENCPRWA